MSVQELVRAVEQLSPEDLRKFGEWFAEYQQEEWDREIAEDCAAGRLGSLIAEARAEYKAGPSGGAQARDVATMSRLAFASTFREDGSLLVPAEAVEALGLHVGDTLTVRIEATDVSDARFDEILDDLLDQARALPAVESVPPKNAFEEAVLEKYRRQGFDL